MIDVNDLKGLLELANDYVDDGLHFLTEPVSYGELKLLAERLISAEKDAARYRWLRDESSNSERTSPLVFMADECADIVTEGWYQGIMFGESLDCAMDEAMQCSK